MNLNDRLQGDKAIHYECADRCTISMARKIPVEQYGNIEIRVEYAMEKEPTGTREALIRKCEDVVIKEFNRLLDMAGEVQKVGKSG